MSVPILSEVSESEIIVKVEHHINALNSNFTQDIAVQGILGAEHNMGTIITKPGISPANPNPNVSTVTYYGVNIPSDNQEHYERNPNVFSDKLEALKAAKKHKKARFKAFKTKAEAEEFAMQVYTETSSTVSSEPPSSPSVGEKPSLFKGPKTQDLVKMRKVIEHGDVHTVEATIWENPRYLISSGDTPAIMHEGSRFNALHIAAKAKNAIIAGFIIQTVGDPKFVELLYGEENTEYCLDRARILLDLYLNTPDKGANETPLHIAAKYGALDVVEVLVSCPQCDKNPVNKWGQTPKEIICSRANSSNTDLKMQIYSLLCEQFYVPVLRSEDNSMQPTIGLPFSPSQPPVFNLNPMESRIEIQAYAGPMDQNQAAVFRKKWRTPPRSNTNSPIQNLNKRLNDAEKGLESVGRDLARECGVDWKEYWPFIDTFTNLSTDEGLQKLERYLEKRFLQSDSAAVSSGNSLEGISQLPHHADTTRNADSSVRQSPGNAVSPMTDLCSSLRACKLADTSPQLAAQESQSRKLKPNPSQPDYVNGNKEEEALINMLTNPGLSPFLYVEKSCQVFGKRIADGLIHIALGGLSTIGDPVSDMLSQEMKHLQALGNSYMGDPRFVSVDFHLVHSRIASIVTARLQVLPLEDFDHIISLCSNVKTKPLITNVSSDEEEAIVNAGTYRSQACTDKMTKRDVSICSSHVKCIAQNIASGAKYQGGKTEELSGKVQTEEDCMRVWSDAGKCTCLWQTQRFIRNSRKGSSYKRLKYIANKDSSRGGKSFEERAKKLDFESEFCKEDCQDNNILGFAHERSTLTEEDEDRFFTPPTSPVNQSPEVSDDEDMSLAEEGEEVFIEGNLPSNTDFSVIQAIKNCNISASQYPNVYRWKHMMLLRTEEERESWGSPSRQRHMVRNICSTPDTLPRSSARKTPLPFKPHESWHRVISPYSPASPQFKSEGFKYHSVPFNM